MSEDVIRQVLARHGYSLRFREHDWVECLIACSAESYRGEGLDRPTALEAALALAFPSRISRELFDVAVVSAERSVGAVKAVFAGGAPVESRPEPAPPPLDRRPPALVRSLDGGASRVPPAPPSRAIASSPSLSEVRGEAVREVSLDALDILSARVDESRPELAWSTAPRQRLAILAWICEARSHTDIFPDDADIRDAVARVSRQLTEIGKAFWPGSVTALQLQMQPGDLPRHLLGGTPTTWARAAELAERALQHLEHEEERRGQDAYGWADADALEPRCEDPEAVLARLVGIVEQSWGPLDRYAEPRNPEDLPDPVLYRRWVRELRWIRGQRVDPDTWARVVGRLRWWACRRNGPVQEEGRELEPTFRPDASWAALLGVSPGASPAGPFSDEELERARGLTAGARIVVAGRRRDPTEQAWLERLLPDAELDFRLIEGDFVNGLAERLTDGGVRLLLGACGLQSAQVDLAFARATREARCTYVRVNRGRAVSCIRALARASLGG